jgi:histidyl-tRNA synthetase
VAEKFKASKGTADILPDAMAGHRLVVETARAIWERAGYGTIETPIFEDTGLFQRGVGDSTDIVRKEMFTFEDQGGRSLTLRPEGTAPVCRAFVEHGMSRLPQPVKLGYAGSFFRHEKPQAGRYRQFHQIGVEAIGTESPLADFEVIALLDELVSELGIPGVTLRIGSLGSLDARRSYLEVLKSYLRERSGELSEDVRERIEINPLRAFDSDHEGTAVVMEGAPRLIDHLDDADRQHFDEVQALLRAGGIEFELDTTLVRGLDYYTRTIFSFVCDRLGAQSEIGGGGRYDGLISQLGGPETPAVGWAAGVERILLALDPETETPSPDVFIAWADEGDRERAVVLVRELRLKGLSAGIDIAGRNLKGQLKQADRTGARWTLILNTDGSGELKRMETGEQQTIDPGDLAGLDLN